MQDKRERFVVVVAYGSQLMDLITVCCLKENLRLFIFESVKRRPLQEAPA